VKLQVLTIFCSLLLALGCNPLPGQSLITEIPSQTFETSEFYKIDSSISKILLQNDGKKILVGSFTQLISKQTNQATILNSGGSQDSHFSTGSGFNGSVNTAVVQPDGKLILGGNFTQYNGTSANRIIRLNSDGTIDSSFNSGTGFSNQVNQIVLQPDGKILVGGVFVIYNGSTSNRIIRLNSDGSIDSTFTTGAGFNGTVEAIALDEFGQILVGGNFTSFVGQTRNRLVRLNSNGSLDTTLNIGTGFSLAVKSIVSQPDGQIIVGGNFTTYKGIPQTRLIRINYLGVKDTTFNVGTGFNGQIYSMAQQSDGKIIAVGIFTSYNGTQVNGIVRLDSTGAIDSGFVYGTGFDYRGTSVESSDDRIRKVKILSNGQIMIAGGFTSYNGNLANSLIRLNSDGSYDSQFKIGQGFNSAVYDVIAKSNDQYLVVGKFTANNQLNYNRIVRLNKDNSLDKTFNIGTGFNDKVVSAVLQPDGKIIVGGPFSSYNGQNVNGLARINSDGSLDTTFNIGTGFSGSDYSMGGVTQIELQPDGKIYVGGDFTSYNGVNQKYIVRLNSDGSLDAVFDATSSVLGAVIFGFSPQADNKVLINDSMIRLNADGSLDNSFNFDFSSDTNITAVFAWYKSNTLSDGKILVYFSGFDNGGSGINHIIRLNPNGQLDTSFSRIESCLNVGCVDSLIIQSDGKILYSESASILQSTGQYLSVSTLKRYNANGTIDAGFTYNGEFNGVVSSLAVSSDQNILVGGTFSFLDGLFVGGYTEIGSN